MIEAARARVAAAANAELTFLYWRIGRRISEEILSGERGRYGEAILATLSQQLVAEYGRGFTYGWLASSGGVSRPTIVATLSQQLRWSHFRELLLPKLPLQREYSAKMLPGDSRTTQRRRFRRPSLTQVSCSNST